MKGFFRGISGLLAILTLGLMIFLFVIAAFNLTFVPENIMTILANVQGYLTIATISCVAFTSVVDRNWIFKIVVILAIAIVVIFSFFPGTRDALLSYIPKG